MSLLIICLIVVGAALVAIKAYFQHKESEKLEKVDLPQVQEKTPELIVSERLAEIAQFEAEVTEEPKKEVTKNDEAEVEKPKAKRKKFYKPKKQQPKIKAK